MSEIVLSVIMPVRDMARYLPSALDSIFAQARQAEEIIVVDDGSTDGSREILETYARERPSIRIVAGAGQGPSKARNLALNEARGNLIAFLDADDLWPAGKLARQLDRLSKTPSVDAVWGYTCWFDEQHPSEFRPADNSRTAEALGVNIGAGIVRRSVFDRIGGFDENLTYSEDVDFVLRMRDAGVPITALPAVALYYRRHAASMTTRFTDAEKADFHRVLLRSIARRKVAGTTQLSPGAVLRDVLEAV